jgi:hypothetical protein
MWPAAREKGLEPTPNTRGMVFNADIDTIVNSLDVGTRVFHSRGSKGP